MEIEPQIRACQLLSELMDKADLHIDLGYTALLFNDKSLAEDVIELHQKMEGVYIEYEELILKLAKNVEAPEKLWIMLRVSDSLKQIVDAANMVADVVNRGLPTHPVLQSIFESSKETFRRIHVSEGSQLEGKTLGEIRLQDITGLRVVCIKRGADWIYGPGSASTIVGGDILYVRGPPEGEEMLANLARAAF